MIEQAVILAAGKGTRLRESDDSLPKPLTVVAGQPLITRTIMTLRDAGVRRVTVVTGFMADLVEKTLRDDASYAAAGVTVTFARNAEFELANGVLCCGREGYVTDSASLTSICEDAAHLAGAIRQESVEEVGGGGSVDAAKDPDAADPAMERALAKVKTDPPEYLTAALPAYRSYARRAGGTFFSALKRAVLLTLALNVPGAAIPIVTITQGAYAVLAVVEGALLAIIFFFMFRGKVRGDSRKYAEEDFFRSYAAKRGLTLEEPLRFAATHAEAKLPFKPDRVMSGPLPGGGEGSLVLSGDGDKRSDRIAVVLGPQGPVAEAGLESEAPGLSTKDLDTYFEQLAGEAREPATSA